MLTTIETVTTSCGVAIQNMSDNPHEDAQVVVLTECCKAAATGSSTGEGLVCKACYSPAPELHGGAGFEVLVEALEAIRCPIVNQCAEDSIWFLSRKLWRA